MSNLFTKKSRLPYPERGATVLGFLPLLMEFLLAVTEVAYNVYYLFSMLDEQPDSSSMSRRSTYELPKFAACDP